MSATAPVPGSGSGLSQPTLPSPPTSIPWLGLLAVLMGTFISTLNGRLSSFGVADAWAAGSDAEPAQGPESIGLLLVVTGWIILRLALMLLAAH